MTPGRREHGVTEPTTKQIEITVDAAQIPVGVNGEALTMPTRVTRTVLPGALRVWLPRHRRGSGPAPKPPVNWAGLCIYRCFRPDAPAWLAGKVRR